MAPTRLAALLCVAMCIIAPATACIFKYGSSPDSLVPGGTHWSWGMKGDDWAGVDASGKPWSCQSGFRQSPINVPAVPALEARGSTIPTRHRTTWSYPTIVSNGTDVEVINNGHTIQVEWLSPYAADVEIVVPAKQSNLTTITSVLRMDEHTQATRVQATPLQFHFHANSEHLLAGKYFPLEMHIVHKITDLPACAKGCFSVLGIMFELSEGADNPLLDAIWAAMPMREGEINTLPAGAEIHLEELLPGPKARDYVSYEGSLTTPPCSEGLLWHVMLKPQKISLAQWAKYQMAVGFKECQKKNATAPATASAHVHRHSSRRMMSTAAATSVSSRMLGEVAAGNPDDYTCNVVAYGYNFRAPQKLYGRTVKLARADD